MGPLNVHIEFKENRPILTILKPMTVLCRVHAMTVDTYIRLTWLGEGGRRIGQRGPPTLWNLFFILIHKCVHRRELNKTDMKKTFHLIYIVTCFVGRNSKSYTKYFRSLGLLCETCTHWNLVSKGGHAVWSLYWNGLAPFALAPFAQRCMEVGN